MFDDHDYKLTVHYTHVKHNRMHMLRLYPLMRPHTAVQMAGWQELGSGVMELRHDGERLCIQTTPKEHAKNILQLFPVELIERMIDSVQGPESSIWIKQAVTSQRLGPLIAAELDEATLALWLQQGHNFSLRMMPSLVRGTYWFDRVDVEIPYVVSAGGAGVTARRMYCSTGPARDLLYVTPNAREQVHALMRECPQGTDTPSDQLVHWSESVPVTNEHMQVFKGVHRG